MRNIRGKKGPKILVNHLVHFQWHWARILKAISWYIDESKFDSECVGSLNGNKKSSPVLKAESSADYYIDWWVI